MNIKDFILGYLIGKQDGGGGASVEPLTVTENGEYSEEGVAYSPVTVNVPAGGSDYTLLGEADFTISRSEAGSVAVGSVSTPDIGTVKSAKNRIIYVRSRDKAGKRNGYHFGNDFFIVVGYNGGTTFIYSVDNDGNLVITPSSTAYGVFPSSIGSATTSLEISARYDTTRTRIIDGTYHVEVYALKWPGDVSPLL